MIDDSDLFHGTYDPVKAHEYYLKRRKLKGRKAGSPKGPTRKEFERAATGREGTYVRPPLESHKQARAQAEQRLEDLRLRLDRLRNILSERVDAAKQRSGVPSTSSSSSSSKSKGSSSSTSGGSTKSPPQTAKQKRDAADRAHKSYEKNKKLKPGEPKDETVAQQIKHVEDQIQEVRRKLKAATENARKTSEAKSKTKTETSTDRRQ